MIIPLVILALAVFGFVVMSLWNWLTPALFGWKLISFWQAVGLVILTRILFGGFRGRRRPGRHWRYRMMERWETNDSRRTRKIPRRHAPPLRLS